MSNTITAKRQRYRFFLSKLQDTTLFQQHVLRELFSRQKKVEASKFTGVDIDETNTSPETCARSEEILKIHKKTDRDVIVAMRDDSDASERYRQTVRTKFHHFNNVFTMATEAYISLMMLPNQEMVKVKTSCPILHTFNEFLQLFYTMPVLFDIDDRHGTFFIKVRDHWPSVIETFIEFAMPESLLTSGQPVLNKHALHSAQMIIGNDDVPSQVEEDLGDLFNNNNNRTVSHNAQPMRVNIT